PLPAPLPTAVILRGGSGSRLWPLSRHYLPKQFLSLMGDRSLFQATVQRAGRLPDAAAPVVVCSDVHRFLVGEQLQEIGVSDAAILLEPVARNTAPAIAVAALHLSARNPGATMLVLPADHLIEDEAAFQQAVARAMALAADGWLVTFGIRPDNPETGYGYIRRGDALGDAVYRVAEFVEKPDLATAQGYLAAGDYSWNSGMFLFAARRYLDELAQHAPDILAAARRALDGAKADLDFIRVDGDAFAASPSDSIDYAVMEKTARAAVVPVSCGWSDIGSWSALWAAAEHDADGNRFEGDVLALDSRNNL